MKSDVIIVLCVALIHHVHSLCTFKSLKQEKTHYGTVRRYCEYEIDDPKSGEEVGTKAAFHVMSGSSFETKDCKVCTCTDYGFICCGTGIKSRLFYTPKGCLVKADGCNPVFVLKSDPNLDCFTKLPIKHTRMVHRMHALLENRKKQSASHGGEEEGKPTTTPPTPYGYPNPNYPNPGKPGLGNFLYNLNNGKTKPTTPSNGEEEYATTTATTPKYNFYPMQPSDYQKGNNPFNPIYGADPNYGVDPSYGLNPYYGGMDPKGNNNGPKNLYGHLYGGQNPYGINPFYDNGGNGGGHGSHGGPTTAPPED